MPGATTVGSNEYNYHESNSTRFDSPKQNKLRFRGAARQMAPFRQLPPLGAEPRPLQVKAAFEPAATDGPFVRKLLTTDVFHKAVSFVSLIEYINKIVSTAAPEGERVANKDRRDFFYRASLRAIFNYTSHRRQVAYERFSPQKSRTQ